MKIRAAGFSLIELMVAILIAAILIAVAVPNFSDTLKGSRTSSQARELAGALAFARSEAITQGAMTMICPSSNTTTCGGTWSQGWIICSGITADCDATGDKVLRVYQGYGNNTLKVFHYNAGGVSALDTRIVFGRNGELRTVDTRTHAATTFAICDESNDIRYARAVLLSALGRPSLAMVGNGIVPRDSGNVEIVCP